MLSKFPPLCIQQLALIVMIKPLVVLPNQQVPDAPKSCTFSPIYTHSQISRFQTSMWARHYREALHTRSPSDATIPSAPEGSLPFLLQHLALPILDSSSSHAKPLTMPHASKSLQTPLPSYSLAIHIDASRLRQAPWPAPSFPIMRRYRSWRLLDSAGI
jgi:hypothetical protein